VWVVDWKSEMTLYHSKILYWTQTIKPFGWKCGWHIDRMVLYHIFFSVDRNLMVTQKPEISK
jgi:hypothetical protein